MLAGILLLGALLAGLAGAVSLTNATLGVGLIAGACLLGIMARLVQADTQHRELLARVGGSRPPAPEPPAQALDDADAIARHRANFRRVGLILFVLLVILVVLGLIVALG